MLRNKSSIRPLDIKENLPEPWKGIQSADYEPIYLNSFVRIGGPKKLATTDIKYNKGHRWGRPKKNSLQSPTGPKSLYKPSEYYTNLTNTSRQSPYR